MANSHKASEQGLKDINQARIAMGWNRTDDRWLEKSEVSRATLNRFLKGETVKHDNFVAICAAVGIENWKRVRQSKVELSIQDELLSQQRPLPQGSQLQQFADQMRRWFGALRYEIEQEEPQTAEYFEWVVRVPVRSRFDRILLRGITREIQLADLREMEAGIKRHLPDETWLVTDYRVSTAVLDWAQKQSYKILCLTFDELIEQDVDFSPYIQWLTQEVQSLGIDEDYIQLNCSKPEIDIVTQAYLGTSHYGVNEGGVEGYVDQWLEAPEKDHISVLGEFGTGKTWFTLHYAWRELQKYQVARQKKMKRSRLPLVMPLRDYAKAVDVENVLAHFFFGKHGIRLNNAVFDRLNEMGKLLLIFDGFDEMADKAEERMMVDIFWQLAEVAVLGAKVILTSRKERFPSDKYARDIFSGQMMPRKEPCLLAPKFEVLELELFDDGQIRQVLERKTDEKTVELIMGNKELLDLARRPVMGDFLVPVLADLQKDLEAKLPMNVARIYYYVVRQKMEKDHTTKRTFTSLADKTYFLCELAWEMLSHNQFTLNFAEFPRQLRSIFNLQDKDIEYWRDDMMSNSLLIRDENGNYKFAHTSFLEYFVAYKFLAELGLLNSDFLLLAKNESEINITEPQPSTWSMQREPSKDGTRTKFLSLENFIPESSEKIVNTLGSILLTKHKVILDFMLLMLNKIVDYKELLKIVQDTRKRPDSNYLLDSRYLGCNVLALLVSKNPQALDGNDLSGTNLAYANLLNVSLRNTDLRGADLSNCLTTNVFGAANAIIVTGDRIITAHDDGSIRTWDRFTGKVLQRLKHHKDWVRAIVLSNDEQYLYSGSNDQIITEWKLIGDKFIHQRDLYRHNCSIRTIILSENGVKLYFGGDDGVIKELDLSDVTNLRTVGSHRQPVRMIILDKSEEFLYSCSDDTIIKQWKMSTGRCQREFEGHTESVRAISLSRNGEFLYSGGDDCVIREWRISDPQYQREFEKGHTKSIRAISLSRNGEFLYSGGDDCVIREWKIADPQHPREFKGDKEDKGHKNSIRAIALSKNEDEKLYSTSSDSMIKEWNVSNTSAPLCTRTFQGYQSSIRSIILSKDEQSLYVGSSDGTIKNWDLKDKDFSCLQVLSVKGSDSSVNVILLSEDEKFIYTGSEDSIIRKWRLSDGDCLMEFKDHQKSVRTIVLNEKDGLLYSGSTDGKIKKWDLLNGMCKLTFPDAKDWVNSITLSIDGDLLYSGNDNKIINEWNINSNDRPQHQFQKHDNWVRSIFLNKKCNILYSASGDGIIKGWNLDKKCEIKPFGDKSSGWINVIVVSEDGRFLYSGSDDCLIRKWDLETNECVNKFEGHQNWVGTIALSKDGKRLYSGGGDGTIRIWNVETNECEKIDPRLCAGAMIAGVKGLNSVQRDDLIALGASEEDK
jgi:WD40 repeat protein